MIVAFLLFVMLNLSMAVDPIPLGVPGTWQLTLNEDFDGTSLNTSLWLPQTSASTGFATGQMPGIACYVNSPNNIAVGGGYLNLTVRQETINSTCLSYQTPFTSGMVSTINRFSQAYGVFEVRARLPNVTVPGLQETFWLWPNNQTLYGTVWPASGEIDFAEFYSQYSNLVVPFIHYNYTSAAENVTAYNCVIDITQFNTYSVEWNATYLTIYYNGKICFYDNWQPQAPLTKPQPFSQPFFIILTQALGVKSNAYQLGVTPLPATTSIDYVRVWQSVTPPPTAPSSSSPNSSPAPTSSAPTSSPDVPSSASSLVHGAIGTLLSIIVICIGTL